MAPPNNANEGIHGHAQTIAVCDIPVVVASEDDAANPLGFVMLDASASLAALRHEMSQHCEFPENFQFLTAIGPFPKPVPVTRQQEASMAVSSLSQPILVRERPSPTPLPTGGRASPSPMTVDDVLRARYQELLDEGQDKPMEQRPIAYSAEDCARVEAVDERLPFVKRLDPRRGKKTSVSHTAAVTVVNPPVDPSRFNFTKVMEEEKLMTLWLAGRQYSVVTNKFPVVNNHLLLVSQQLEPQVMTRHHLEAITSFMGTTGSFRLCFNSWSGAASVNHFHLQLVDDVIPIETLPLQPLPEVYLSDMANASDELAQASLSYMPDHPAVNVVFKADDMKNICEFVMLMQANNQPHNIVFSHDHTFIFPRHTDPCKRGQLIYGVEAGVFELAGIFTTFSEAAFEELSAQKVNDLMQHTTMAPKFILSEGQS